MINSDGGYTKYVYIIDTKRYTTPEMLKERIKREEAATPKPIMDNPHINIPNFPFKNKPYARRISACETDRGGVGYSRTTWYADKAAIGAFKTQLYELTRQWPQKLRLKSYVRYAKPVEEAPRKVMDFPLSSVWCVKFDKTPTGRDPKYPAAIGFCFSLIGSQIYEEMDDEEQDEIYGNRQLNGFVKYLADGRIGYADISRVIGYTTWDAKYRMRDDGIKLTSFTKR